MKYSPILLSTPMVQAILNGSKTQTRRVVKPQPPVDYNYEGTDTDKSSGESIFYACWEGSNFHNVKSPYGQIGDVLWVRERMIENTISNSYWPFADGYTRGKDGFGKYFKSEKNVNSIHMPKEACRLFLKIKDIRVERLSQITENDAISEGIKKTWIHDDISQCKFKNYIDNGFGSLYARDSFFSLWESINGKESLDSNPWVWVIEFERIEKPIDFC